MGTPKSSILIGFSIIYKPSILGILPLFLVQHPFGPKRRIFRGWRSLLVLVFCLNLQPAAMTPTRSVWVVASNLTARCLENGGPGLSRCMDPIKNGDSFQQSLCDRLPEGSMS